MKKLILLISALYIITFISYSQGKVSLQDLKTPNSPGFQILDIAPSSIEKPTNPKEFALTALNLTNNKSALPTNFALEISPYWFFKPANENVYKYLNLTSRNNGKTNVVEDGNPTGGILRKLSISIASSLNDSSADNLLSNTNYVSFGARTNVITINGKKRTNALTAAFKTMRTEIAKAGFKPGGGLNTPDEIETALQNDEDYQQAIKSLSVTPLFQLDAAYAYSEAFADNKYADKRFNRSGVWLSGTLSAASLSKTKGDNLSFVVIGRIIWDNALTDTVNNLFERKNAYDFGGKIDYSIGRFSISVEHLNRVYSGNTSFNSNRTVGTMQYKVNDNLYLTGTFGQNFGNSSNLITLLGINCGFGNAPLSTTDSK